MFDPVVSCLMSPGRGEQLPTLEDWLARPEWHAQADCRGTGTAAFIQGRGGDYGPARAMCARCEVRAEGLQYSLDDATMTGLWGGTTDAERRELRRAVA